MGQLMQLVDPVVEPVAGASAWTKKLGLPCENQATRDATYFKAQMEKLAQMKARDERNAANKAAGIETNDSRSLKNTKWAHLIDDGTGYTLRRGWTCPFRLYLTAKWPRTH